MVKFKKLHKDAKMPFRAHKTDAGADLYATSIERSVNGVITYGCGISLEIPDGYEAQIRPRSSIYKTDLIMCNSPGTIDSSFRGEIMVKFRVLDKPAKVYEIGDRIAQIVINKVELLDFEEVNDLTETERGNGGFGSTNK